MGPLPKNSGPYPKIFWFWRGLLWGQLSNPPLPPPLGESNWYVPGMRYHKMPTDRNANATLRQ